MDAIAILTGGGPAPGMNTVVGSVAKTFLEKGYRVLGLHCGYSSLFTKNPRITEIDFLLADDIFNRGGSFLTMSRFKPTDKNFEEDFNLDLFVKNNIKLLVTVGGDDTASTANRIAKFLEAKKYPIANIHVPKTIDNDLWGTDMTFGFQSAVDIATHVIDCIHTTATSHGRVFIVEVMGHKVGWLTLYAGISGGADVILIPELPYDVDKVCKVLKKRRMQGKPFSILAVAEGAISKEESKLSKKEFKAARAQMKEPSVSYRLANEIAERTGQEIRVTIPGHFQRGGSPCAYDRVLSTRFGTAAAELIAQKKFGYMVAIRNNLIVPVPLSEVAGKLKTVSPDCDEIRAARDMGISLGD